jgi:hypothetical protein
MVVSFVVFRLAVHFIAQAVDVYRFERGTAAYTSVFYFGARGIHICCIFCCSRYPLRRLIIGLRIRWSRKGEGEDRRGAKKKEKKEKEKE